MGGCSRCPVTSLYVHVPFCAQKCSYCAFYSEPSGGEEMNRYVEALVGELELVAPNLRPHTVFFGGGTPTLLNLRQWERILRVMERLDLLGAQEWTVECNPATVSRDKATLLRGYGVNRVSMGVQSLDDQLLERLGRIHSRPMVFRSFDLLRGAGFDNVNLDLMFAIPGQSLDVWRETLKEALAMGSEHLSSYEVSYEETTPFHARFKSGELGTDEDLACSMYEELVEQAVSAGFEQYEVANFARTQRSQLATAAPQSQPPGRQAGDNGSNVGSEDKYTLELPRFACRHNVNYWRGGSFYGLGPSATSYVAGRRTRNWPDTRRYCENLERGTRAIESAEELSPLPRAGETAAFGLRMVAGWLFEQFQETTGYDLRQEWAEDMAELAGKGWARLRPDRFQLTAEGLRFADAAARSFLR